MFRSDMKSPIFGLFRILDPAIERNTLTIRPCYDILIRHYNALPSTYQEEVLQTDADKKKVIQMLLATGPEIVGKRLWCVVPEAKDRQPTLSGEFLSTVTGDTPASIDSMTTEIGIGYLVVFVLDLRPFPRTKLAIGHTVGRIGNDLYLFQKVVILKSSASEVLPYRDGMVFLMPVYRTSACGEKPFDGPLHMITLSLPTH